MLQAAAKLQLFYWKARTGFWEKHRIDCTESFKIKKLEFLLHQDNVVAKFFN